MGTRKKNKAKRNKGKRKNLFIFKYLLLASLCLGIVLFYVWERVELLEAGYKIKERGKRKEKLTEEREALLLRVARLKSPQRLERIAGEEIGLIAPRPGQSIRTIKYQIPKSKIAFSSQVFILNYRKLKKCFLNFRGLSYGN
ncbi:hypothetical protein KAU86_01400 [bacterium]|nr:hypothetical protein [bacterium]MCK4325950.1 hypothetical protein [bacterium]MCK4436582.1 hypothetical protein [bacterium]